MVVFLPRKSAAWKKWSWMPLTKRAVRRLGEILNCIPSCSKRLLSKIIHDISPIFSSWIAIHSISVNLSSFIMIYHDLWISMAYFPSFFIIFPSSSHWAPDQFVQVPVARSTPLWTAHPAPRALARSFCHEKSVEDVGINMGWTCFILWMSQVKMFLRCLLLFVDVCWLLFSLGLFFVPRSNHQWQDDKRSTAFLRKKVGHRYADHKAAVSTARCGHLTSSKKKPAWKVKWSLTPKFWSLFLTIGMSRKMTISSTSALKNEKIWKGWRMLKVWKGAIWNKWLRQDTTTWITMNSLWIIGCGRSIQLVRDGSGCLRVHTQDLGLVRYGFR